MGGKRRNAKCIICPWFIFVGRELDQSFRIAAASCVRVVYELYIMDLFPHFHKGYGHGAVALRAFISADQHVPFRRRVDLNHLAVLWRMG